MLSDLQTRKLMQLFRLLDTDAGGTLEEADFQRALDRLVARRNVSPGSLEHAYLRVTFTSMWRDVQAADQDGDGAITPDEWLAHHAAHIGSAHFESMLHAQCDVIFNLLDIDGDGKISADEYALWLDA